jgi:hypothetical protein
MSTLALIVYGKWDIKNGWVVEEWDPSWGPKGALEGHIN